MECMGRNEVKNRQIRMMSFSLFSLLLTLVHLNLLLRPSMTGTAQFIHTSIVCVATDRLLLQSLKVQWRRIR